MKQTIRLWALAIVILYCSGIQAQSAKQAKYVFLFIGDGMATVQRTSANYYLGMLNEHLEGQVTVQKLVMNTFPAHGLTSTHSISDIITDSSAAATALATGRKTRSGVVSMDLTKQHTFKTIAEDAKERGFRVGIVTSVSLDHATPACFYAHNPSRDNYYAISKQLAESNFDYFAGGQMKGNLPGNKRNKPDLVEYAKEQGYMIATNRTELLALMPGQKAIAYTACDSDAALNYAIDRKPDEVSLAEFTRKGIDLLCGPSGFFMMVEGGKIDWACHANDAAAAIQEVLAFDMAISEAVEFAKQHPDETLIVVTGDHETGGMAMGFAATQYSHYPERIKKQTQSFKAFNKQVETWRQSNTTFELALPVIKQTFGFDRLKQSELEQLEQAYVRSLTPSRQRANNDQTYLMYGTYESITVTCTHLVNQQAGIGWTSYAHSGVPVTTSATGVGSELFNGFYDNTDIHHKIAQVMGLPQFQTPYKSKSDSLKRILSVQ